MAAPPAPAGAPGAGALLGAVPVAVAAAPAIPSPGRQPHPASAAPPPVLDVVVPVFNEERVLEASVRRLRSFLDAGFPWPALVTVVDNGSTDATGAVADRLAATVPGVRVRHLAVKGRGLALRTAWAASEAAVVAYMDVDLSTSLSALLPLVAPLVSGHSDVAIGTRLARGARVVRGPKRELISRTYNAILRACLHNGFTDAQCGFKAARADAVRALLPEVLDNNWFFDTELLVAAERRTLRIHEVPVDWVDDPDSRVAIVRTALDDLRGVLRLLRSPHPGGPVPGASPGGRDPAAVAGAFARVGLASTALYLALFLALRGALGPYGANAVSLALCTVANALAHGRTTFAGRRPLALRRLLGAGAAAWVASLAFTSAALGALGALGLLGAASSALWEVGALVAASAAAGGVRFFLLHAWMFRRAEARTGSVDPKGERP
jgi:putative flippase GtrA